MLSETLIDRMPAWAAGDAPDGAEAVCTLATVVRNLADFPFPARCSNDERQAVLDRVQLALESSGLLAGGQFRDFADIDAREARFLVERRLITRAMLAAPGPKGVYVAVDQSLCVMVNGDDHVCIRAQCAGLQPEGAWRRANAVDDALSSAMDFAYSESLGYLSSELGMTGTGLKTSAVLHLPGLAHLGELHDHAQRIQPQRTALRGVRAGAGPATDAPARLGESRGGPVRGEPRVNQSLYSDVEGPCWGSLAEALADLFVVVNERTLGLSEEETLFNVRHAAAELIAAERAARARLLSGSTVAVEDRVGRARGLASGVRLLGFAEGLSILSALRLGAALGLLPGRGIESMNRMLLSSQGAHLELALGDPVDALALNRARADLFRSQFAG